MRVSDSLQTARVHLFITHELGPEAQKQNLPKYVTIKRTLWTIFFLKFSKILIWNIWKFSKKIKLKFQINNFENSRKNILKF